MYIHGGVLFSSGVVSFGDVHTSRFYRVFYLDFPRDCDHPQEKGSFDIYDTFEKPQLPHDFEDSFWEIPGRYTTPYPARNHFPHVTGSLMLFSASYKLDPKPTFPVKGCALLNHWHIPKP